MLLECKTFCSIIIMVDILYNYFDASTKLFYLVKFLQQNHFPHTLLLKHKVQTSMKHIRRLMFSVRFSLLRWIATGTFFLAFTILKKINQFYGGY